MPNSRLMLVLLAAGALLVATPAAHSAGSASQAPAAQAAAKKKCKKGYKRVTVKKAGKTKKVCRKKKKAAGPAGPSVAEVESIIRGIEQAGHETWLGPESMEVTFEQPTKILPMRQYDPYAADPLDASGPVPAWPVLAWVKTVNHRDDTPEDDTTFGGCLGHQNDWWPYDSLFMFFRGDSGEWTYLTSTDDDGECG